ncbi:MAG: Nif3-like dinuclear metal center hexameric protein [Sphingomonadales bacterium]|nr:Nif3-like dinuclear metal center hexameric protein [Sphingomonadales bacterium]
MITLSQIARAIERRVPPALQESYDNSGLLVGRPNAPVSAVLCTLDLTEAVLDEAASKGCGLVVAHHPIIFRKLGRLTEDGHVERCVMRAIELGIGIYALHTNLDHLKQGVSRQMALKMGWDKGHVLRPMQGVLRQLTTFVPITHADTVREALFSAGAGWVGSYSHASFNLRGEGTFQPEEGSNPFSGGEGTLERVDEMRIELVYPHWLEGVVLKALFDAHPYEEVAYNILKLENKVSEYGAGWLTELSVPLDEMKVLRRIKSVFGAMIRHTPLLGRPVRSVALCGGSGSFLLSDAIAAGADLFLTADFKYHEFFEADQRIVIADLGHYETEQFVPHLIADNLSREFANFAVLISETPTNPVSYL